jgi:hypothetical protein
MCLCGSKIQNRTLLKLFSKSRQVFLNIFRLFLLLVLHDVTRVFQGYQFAKQLVLHIEFMNELVILACTKTKNGCIVHAKFELLFDTFQSATQE